MNPEVRPKANPRRFTVELKKHILDEAVACTGRSELGTPLHREGLYSSLLTQWHCQHALGYAGEFAYPKPGQGDGSRGDWH